ncbi:MAG: [protein-PII] uridylyltransferase [Deltaproteobacteria bacterium]|nr:[protein-PII] uridylyltransferase [Deltaproteobacteria bacterium]
MAAPAPDPRSAEASAALRAALDDARARMRSALAVPVIASDGPSTVGADACAALSAIYDRAIAARWRQATADLEGIPLALVATGGWARRELAPYSDIDFILLHGSGSAAERAARTAADRLLYPLWDARVAVGHAVREPRAAARLAKDDLATATALIDTRHVVGDPALTTELVRHARAAIAPGGNANDFVRALADEKLKRHDRFGDSLYLLEPNLKQGQGALRDLATALWAAAARWNPIAAIGDLAGKAGPVDPSPARLIEALITLGHLTRRQGLVLADARDFLLRVRAQLQLAADRRVDQLTFEIQEAIAPILYPDATLAEGDVRPAVAPAVEALMRAYYLHARGALQVAERLLESARVPARRRPRIGKLDATLLTWNGELAVTDPKAFAARPSEMLRLFRVAVEKDLPVYGHTRELVAEQVAALAADPVRALTSDPQAQRLFLDALVDPADRHQPSMLEIVHQVGLLAAVMPEWAPCTGRVQHDLYHVYTVDQHQLYAVAMLKRIARGELATEHPTPTAAYATIARRAPLYLATLLHDVGKPLGKGHAEKGAVLAGQVARRLGFTEEDIELTEFLVRQHLTMSHLSQRRDLADPEVVVRFAERIGDEARLAALYLLTLCDTAMTNPNNLTAWKGELLRELYLRTRDALRGDASTDGADDRADARKRVLAACLEIADPATVAAFVDNIDARFLSQLTPRQAARQVRLVFAQQAAGTVADIGVAHFPMRGISEVAVVAPDVPGALAAIAGVLTANRVDVLGAVLGHADRGQGGLALDLFFVRDLVGAAIADNDPRWARIAGDLRELFADGVPDPAKVAQLIARRRPPSGLPPRITPAVTTEIRVVDDSAAATIVEVFTRDRQGVLHAITKTLADLGLDISLAKISTEGEKVADVFYVSRSGPSGRVKLTDPDEIAAVIATIEAALEAL